MRHVGLKFKDVIELLDHGFDISLMLRDMRYEDPEAGFFFGYYLWIGGRI
ncbi:hypothetical protein GCM10009690_26050 [Brevibacterium permense]|uniref:Uncharacterized protein n=1 Tax=Brevibacterium permense TaxID=234834 RepID=A0ABN2AMI9_9MICO